MVRTTIAFEQALKKVLASAKSSGTEDIELERGHGRILGETLDAPWDLPVHDHSAMDGYAVRSQDLERASLERPVGLDVIGTAHAGEISSPGIGPGEALRLMTGAKIPAGADTVVRQERVEIVDAKKISVTGPVRSGRDMRRRGEDVLRGSRVLAAGTELGPQEIAVLAALGQSRVVVRRAPKVTIIATGDELVSATDASEDRVVDSNGPMLAAMVQGAGGHATRSPLVADLRLEVEHAVLDAVACSDLVLSIGGASVGEKDLLQSVLAGLGFDESFWTVAIKPGKPTGFGHLRGVPFFALPGNPRAVAAIFRLLVEPMLHQMLGTSPVAPFRTLLRDAVQQNPTRLQALRGRVSHGSMGLHVQIFPDQNSGKIGAAIGSNALVLVPPGNTILNDGTEVDAVLDGPIVQDPPLRLLGFIGPSNTGKTTLIVRLLEVLSQEFELGALKHGHRFELDRPGKDSQRFRDAGARVVALASPTERAVMAQTAVPTTLKSLLRTLPGGLDGVLIEGFKNEGTPAIEVHRAGHPLLCRTMSGANILGVVTDAPKEVPDGLPVFSHDDHAQLVAFARAYFRRR